MDILLLIAALLSSNGYTLAADTIDKNKINIVTERTFDEDQEFIRPNHVVITFVKEHKCTASIELPENYSQDVLYKIMGIQRQRCMNKFKVIPKKRKPKNPKILINL